MLHFNFTDYTCLTVDNDVPSMPCILPFMFEGVRYTNCTWHYSEYYGTSSTGNQPWCPTAVDDQAHFLSDKGKETYGICGVPGCQNQLGKCYNI